jgi:hypothetical protein
VAEEIIPKEEKPVPGCKAILLCERIMVEARTRKVSLIGLVTKLILSEIPGRTEPMKIFRFPAKFADLVDLGLTR